MEVPLTREVVRVVAAHHGDALAGPGRVQLRALQGLDFRTQKST